MSKKMDSKFRNELVAKAVAALARDLSKSTWGEAYPAAMQDLLDYRTDIAGTISRAVFVQNNKEQTLPEHSIGEYIKKEYYKPNATPVFKSEREHGREIDP